MIHGNGVDLIEIERIQNIVEKKPHFLTRFFTEGEIALFKSKNLKIETIAANFAAKEAVSKALGTGVRGFNLKDVEILRDKWGAPYVVLHGEAAALSEQLGIKHWSVSLSHTKMYAVAFVIAEK